MKRHRPGNLPMAPPSKTDRPKEPEAMSAPLAAPDTGARRRLPNRRPNETRRLCWQAPDGGEHVFEVTVGFFPAPDDAGQREAGEVFASGHRTGSVMAALVEDACVMASNLRQHGVTFADLAPRLGHQSDGSPASPAGAILNCAASIEAAAGRGATQP